jgi:hypothetical protein
VPSVIEKFRAKYGDDGVQQSSTLADPRGITATERK